MRGLHVFAWPMLTCAKYCDILVLGSNLDDGPPRHTSCMQLQLSHTCTAPHPATTDTRRCQDACPQHHVIAAGLRQHTATRHVGQEPRQVIGGTELTSQPGWFVRPPVLHMPLSYDSSSTGCRFANELPTKYRWSHTRREPPAPHVICQSHPRLHTNKNITIFQQTATDYTLNISWCWQNHSVSARLQSGTHCHIVVDPLRLWLLSNML